MPVNSSAAPTPFDEALIVINANVGSNQANALAKLILSLYNQHFAFSMSEILLQLDHHNTRLALRLVADFGYFGATKALGDAGHILLNDSRFGHLAELAEAIIKVKKERCPITQLIAEACHG